MLRFNPILSPLVALAFSISMAVAVHAAEAVPDPAVTVYGTRNAAAPTELDVFAFLIGKWSGTMQVRGNDGKYSDYPLEWTGRYALNGMAIADDIRIPGTPMAGAQGLTLRYFDTGTQRWTVEYFNFVQSFLRKQVNADTGAVRQEGNRVTVEQSGPGDAPGREVYTLVDAEHFTYSLDMSKDSQWDAGVVTMQMQRQEKAP